MPPSSLDTGISLTNAAARMIAMTSARRSHVFKRRHQFSILEPCSRAIIAARVRLQRCCARLAAQAMRKAMVRPTKEALEVAYTSSGLLGGSSMGVRGLRSKLRCLLVSYMPLVSPSCARALRAISRCQPPYSARCITVTLAVA